MSSTTQIDHYSAFNTKISLHNNVNMFYVTMLSCTNIKSSSYEICTTENYPLYGIIENYAIGYNNGSFLFCLLFLNLHQFTAFFNSTYSCTKRRDLLKKKNICEHFLGLAGWSTKKASEQSRLANIICIVTFAFAYSWRCDRLTYGSLPLFV